MIFLPHVQFTPLQSILASSRYARRKPAPTILGWGYWEMEVVMKRVLGVESGKGPGKETLIVNK